MTPQCQVCGTFESENTTIVQGHDVCYDCVDMLVENEVERRGLAREAKAFAEYWGDTGSNHEAGFIQDLKDAGRYRG